METKSLRSAGLKVTLPRMRILEILERSPTRHLSAEEIYRKLLEAHRDHSLILYGRCPSCLARRSR